MQESDMNVVKLPRCQILGGVILIQVVETEHIDWCVAVTLGMSHFNLTALKDHLDIYCREMKDFGKMRLGDFTDMKVDKHVAVNPEVSMS
jgi:hypothetical protein